MRILTVNVGSSSLKLAVITDGEVEHVPQSLDDALSGPRPDAVAHRVVHGGDRDRAVVINEGVLAELHALSELAPLHQPPALDAINRCRRAWPAVPNVACFDTAFHRSIPPAATTYALPARLRSTVRAYGFHGLSYAWAAARLGQAAPDARRVLVAHLGSGQSLCGLLDGRSVVTTMGFTPLDGLVMGTRCGTLDPGAVVWLQQHTDEDLGEVFERESGLLGLCGTSDLRVARQRAAGGDADAQLAVDVWSHRILRLAGGCIATLAGIDAIAFTGGIGEHDASARAALLGGFAWLCTAADVADHSTVEDIRELTAPGARVRSFVVRAREDLQLARETASLLAERG
jgi:acetate kinase